MASTRQSLLSLQSTATTSSSTYTSTSGLIHGEYVHVLPYVITPPNRPTHIVQHPHCLLQCLAIPHLFVMGVSDCPVCRLGPTLFFSPCMGHLRVSRWHLPHELRVCVCVVKIDSMINFIAEDFTFVSWFCRMKWRH